MEDHKSRTDESLTFSGNEFGKSTIYTLFICLCDCVEESLLRNHRC